MIDYFLRDYYDYKRKARKEHFCCECRTIILKGEGYIYGRGFSDDYGLEEFKWCIDCKKLYDEMNDAIDGNWDDGIGLGNMINEFYDGENDEEFVKRMNDLLKKAKTKREKNKDLIKTNER